MDAELYALTEAGPERLPVPPGVTSHHELFDGLALGVYSALRTFEHERFLALDWHLERTERSMALLGWTERLERGPLCAALARCVRAWPGDDSAVRFDVLAEPARKFGREERVMIALAPFTPVAPALLEAGVTVRCSDLRRDTPLIKKAAFVIQRRPYPLGKPEAFEHLMLDDRGTILEGTSSNFCALVGRTLRLAGDGALQGVTQRVLSELARAAGLEVVRAPVSLDELARVDEAFLSSSIRGPVPVVRVEEQRLGDGRPGPWTRRLIADYYAHARAAALPAL
jgi:branched-chain amino acid aminotransferase